MAGGYLLLKDLLPYKMSIELSRICWKLYEKWGWKGRKIIGDQFITSVDSVGANIAEGYGRYHYLDRIKFYYNSRGSLMEAKHWTLLLKERNKVSVKEYDEVMEKMSTLHMQLNIYIRSCHQNR